MEPRTGDGVSVAENVETLHPLLTRFVRPIAWCDQGDVSVQQVSGARRFIGVQPAVLGLHGRCDVELLKQVNRSIGVLSGVVIRCLSERQRGQNLNEEKSDEHESGSAALPLHTLPTSGNLIKDCLCGQPRRWHGEGSRVSVLGRCS